MPKTTDDGAQFDKQLDELSTALKAPTLPKIRRNAFKTWGEYRITRKDGNPSNHCPNESLSCLILNFTKHASDCKVEQIIMNIS